MSPIALISAGTSNSTRQLLAAHFDETALQWLVETDRGDTIAARFCIMATGCLSSARVPDFKGLSEYAGQTYHTGYWPHEPVSFTGKRVAVIGTGSSAIQAIPVIAEQADHVTVFQRTPNYSIPSRNGPMLADYERSWKEDYVALREKARRSRNGILANPNDQSALDVTDTEREAVYEARWEVGGTSFMAAFNDLISSPEANETCAEFVRNKIRTTVKDPEAAELLAAKDYPIGTKRICVDTRYFETYNRPNVTLIDVRDRPIERLTQEGLLHAGIDYSFDAIVFATGFDAMTGTLDKIDIRGRKDIRLRDEWTAGPRTLPRHDVSRLPQPVHDNGSTKSVCTFEHDGLDRAARRLDDRLHCPHASGQRGDDRTDNRGSGCLG